MLPLFVVFASACDTSDTKLVEEHVELKKRVAELEARETALASQVEQLAGQVEKLAAAPAKPVEPAVLTLEMSATSMRVGSEVVDRERLEALLRERKAEPGGVSLTIAASTDVPHARVVEVLEGAKRAGLEKIAITSPKSGAP